MARSVAPRAFAPAALLLGLVGAAIAGEFLLRAFWPQRSALTIGMFREDPSAGYSLAPNYRNEVRVPEYRISICTDAEGLRVPEGGETESEDAVRILAVGDSFTFGVGVNAEKAWPEVLEELLASAGRRRVAVRNGGVGGYGPLRTARLLFARHGRWKPDIVIHGLYLGNDLEDPAPEDVLRYPRIDRGRMVVPRRSPLARLRHELRIRSHLYAFLRDRFYGLYQATPLAARSQYLDPVGLAQWPSRVLERSWPAGQDAIRQIAAWAREHDAKYLVVLIPLKYQVSEDAWKIYRRRWHLPDEAFDRYHAQREVAAFLRREGIAYLDLLPELLRATRAGAATYYRVDNHWSAEGHRVASRRIREELERRGWIAAASATHGAVAQLRGEGSGGG